LFELCEPGALTPYHGYWKNLSLSLMPGAWDRHHHPLSDNGHIQFCSMGLLRALLVQAGFTAVRFQRVGRIPALAKSMIAVAQNCGANSPAETATGAAAPDPGLDREAQPEVL
jgi:hypothetical protein